MDQLISIHRLTSGILLLLAISYYSCEGISFNISVALRTWENPDVNFTFLEEFKLRISNLTDSKFRDSVNIFCGPSSWRKKKLASSVLHNTSCKTFVPGRICKRGHYDPHMVSFDNAIYSSRINFIHCGMGRFSGFGLALSNWNVKHLDLSSSGLTYLPSGIFRHFTSLKCLNLSNNVITGYDREFSLGLSNLRNIDLSNNRLTEMDLNWINFNTTLEVKLSSNNIASVRSSVLPNQSLLIDLSFNSLTCIDEPLEVFLKTNITINLDGNPFTCECLQSLRKGTYDSCICENPTQLRRHQSIQPVYTEACLEHVEDIISLKIQIFVGAAFLAGSLITFLFMYRNRRILCRCVRYPIDLSDLVIQPSEMKSYENHAYIVCDDKDHEILKMLILELEEKRQMKIVCEARDNPPNHFQIGYIENCLSSSRRTIFVMSANFLENKLCLYVLNLAASMEYLEQKCVIIILKVKPFTKEQEKILEKLTFHKIWYEYPCYDENSESFWNTLATAINDPKLHFQILGIHDSDVAKI